MTAYKWICRYVGVFFTLTVSVAALAESRRVFEHKPVRGYARPPLLVNITPFVGTSYNPAQIRHAYGVDLLTADGTGQKIAIVDAYGNKSIQTDLDTFCTQFGLPKGTVTILGNNTGSNKGWALETALDVEWAHAIATNATIILSVARSNGDADLLAAIAAATNAGATVVSMSWGGTEWNSETAYDRYFQTPGVTYVASSGDSGELPSLPEVEWPAVSPYVVGVGGTSLYLDANGNRTSPETAWSGSGGGLSSVYGLPVWQNDWFPQWLAKRGVPDVSLVADPNTGVLVYDAANGGWYIVGGTSASAPMWAALIALANQQRGAAGTLTSANATLYSLARVAPTPYSINSTYFFDVASGSNGGDPDDISGPGYDLVTGLGTPVANALVPALAGFRPDFSLSVNPSSQPVAAGGVSTNYTVTVTATNGFTGTVTLSSSGLPAGSTYSFNPATVAGSGTSILSVTTPGGTAAGVYPFIIAGTSGSLGHTASATLIVGPPPAPAPISPSTSGQSATPAYTFSTVSGAASYSIFLWDYAAGTSTETRWYTAAEVDPGKTGTGTIPQATPLAVGQYAWFVNAQNAFGVGPWSPFMVFGVGP